MRADPRRARRRAQAGVIHRDLKPENLFLARDPEKPGAKPRLKILDFGLARIAEGSAKTIVGRRDRHAVVHAARAGRGARLRDRHRSDLFAVGASCFRILAGRTVHPADGALAICARMAREPAPKLRSVAPSVSEETALVIDKALEFKREDRWQDAASMREAADEAIHTLGGQTVEIDSGMIEVAERQESRMAPAPASHQSPPPVPAAKVSSPRPPPSSRRDETTEIPEPPKHGSSWFIWLVILVLTGVAAKLVYDYFNAKPPIVVVNSEDALVAPTASSSSVIAIPPPIDAAVEVPLVVDASIDVEIADAESVDATVDASAADADVADVHGVTPLVTDAGTHATHERHDAGTHHNNHHHTHRR